MNKFIKSGFILLLTAIFITGCSNIKGKDKNTITQNNKNQKEDIERDMEYLTSNECDGRRSGTLGNEKAGSYIAKRFKEIGLQTLADDYFIPYTKQTETLDETSIKLEVLDSNKVLETLEYGKDYMEIFVDSMDISLPLVSTVGNEDCAILTDDSSEVTKLSKNPNVKLIIKKVDELHRAGTFYEKGSTPVIGVFPKAFNKLKSNVKKTIRFTVNVSKKDIIQNNIVGIIKGSSSDNALLISAHFDHVGSIKDMIWSGALDNASGVCVLLETAKTLLKDYQNSKPPFDIIFCTFNSEETMYIGNSGGSYFQSFIQEKYKSIFDINLDCIGDKESSQLIIHQNDTTISEQIGNDIIKNFKDAGFDIVTGDGGFVSDYKNFNNSLCLTTISNTEYNKIHTINDTVDKIDIKFLIDVGKQFERYIYKELSINEIFKEFDKEQPSYSTVTPPVRTDGLTVLEFEKLYHCKLNFADESLTKIFPRSSNRKDLKYPLSNNTKESEPTSSEMTLWDLRSFTFVINTSDLIQFATYDKGNPFEVMAYESDGEANGYTDENLSYLTTMEGTKYYILNGKNYYREILAEFENENYFIRVIIAFEFNSKATKEEYLNYIKKNIPIKYIIEMVKMLLEVKSNAE